ncbi:50S ribosomal protein L13 [Candidatus Collierbacteria bacterium]|nr:50S ribosomal protein L13 [Candidatus Collierbacteria bacterium]
MKRTETKQLPITENSRKWHLVDLSGQILGRAVTGIAGLIIGKTKTSYATHTDCGDYVVAINAGKIKVTGQKLQEKIYYRHTGYPTGLRQIGLDELMKKDPAKVIKLAVLGMLPKNKLQNSRIKRLKVFADENHKYSEKFKS